MPWMGEGGLPAACLRAAHRQAPAAQAGGEGASRDAAPKGYPGEGGSIGCVEKIGQHDYSQEH